MLEDSRIILLVDMDGTINEFDEHFVVWLKTKGYDFDWSKFTSWNISEGIIGARDGFHQQEIFKEILDDPRFWVGIPVMPEAQEILSRLDSTTYHIKICTNPWGTDPIFRKVKLDWLSQHFPFIPHEDVIFTGHDKWNIEGDIIFDDKPEVLEECMKQGKKVVVKSNRSYNKTSPSHFHFSHWGTVVEILALWWREVFAQNGETLSPADAAYLILGDPELREVE